MQQTAQPTAQDGLTRKICPYRGFQSSITDSGVGQDGIGNRDDVVDSSDSSADASCDFNDTCTVDVACNGGGSNTCPGSDDTCANTRNGRQLFTEPLRHDETGITAC